MTHEQQCRNNVPSIGQLGDQNSQHQVSAAANNFSATTALFAAVTAGVLTALVLLLFYVLYRQRRSRSLAAKCAAQVQGSQQFNAMLHACSPKSMLGEGSSQVRAHHNMHSTHSTQSIQEAQRQIVRVPFQPSHRGIQTTLSDVRSLLS